MKLFVLLLVTFSYCSVSICQIFSDSCNTPFWGIVNASGDTSYLLGTFHEFGNSFFNKHPQTMRYKHATCIVTETQPPRDRKPDLSNNWLKTISKAEKKLIDTYISNNFGAKLKHIKHAPPAWIHFAIFSKLYKEQCNVWTEQDKLGMDESLIYVTTKYKIKWMGLEAPEDTFNARNIMVGAVDNNDPAGVTKLIDIIANKQKYIDTINTMCWEADNYRNQNFNYHFGELSTTENKDFAILLDKRNDAWMAKLKNIIDTNRAYIGVGIKHLYYKKGLIMQLVNSGYRVFPISLQ